MEDFHKKTEEIDATFVFGDRNPLLSASKPVLRRLCALKKNQQEINNIRAAFYQRVHELEAEFQPAFDQIQGMRKAIVTGIHEPNENECDAPLLTDFSPEALQKLMNNAPAEVIPSKGVPDFWLNVLKNTNHTEEMIQEWDAPILKHLIDITSQIHVNPNGFSILFHFEENEYFTNAIIKREYEFNTALDPKNPYVYDGSIPKKTQGTLIDWKEGMDVLKQHANESFFAFFDPSIKECSEDIDSECKAEISYQFLIGEFIRDEIIPNAVLFYTDEADQDSEYSSDDEDDDEGQLELLEEYSSDEGDNSKNKSDDAMMMD
jgi:hypothetical protein